MKEGKTMAEGKPCVIRVGKRKFEARNLPRRTPGADHRHVGGTFCPIGFTCNSCGHITRKYAKITSYTDYFRKWPKGSNFTRHLFCPECFEEIIFESASGSFISGATVYFPPGCEDHERKPGFVWYPYGVRLDQTE